MMETPRACRGSRDICPGYPGNRTGSGKLDSCHTFVQSTPVTNESSKARTQLHTITSNPIYGNMSELWSPLLGHTSPVTDEGYYSSLSSLSTMAHASRELAEEKLVGNCSTNNETCKRGCGLRGTAAADSSCSRQSAFSPVTNENVHARTQSVVQSNSFWTALSTLRQQLHQTVPAVAAALPQPPPPHPVTSPHPMLLGNAAPTTPLSYFPSLMLWPSNQLIRNHVCPAYELGHPYHTEPSGFLCERVISQLRQEMLGLVESSMKQFETYICHSAAAQQHQPPPLCRPQFDLGPLNLHSDTTAATTTSAERRQRRISVEEYDCLERNYSEAPARRSDVYTPPKPTARITHTSKRQPEYHHQQQQHQQLHQQQHALTRRRRLRIRSTGRRLRIKQPVVGVRSQGQSCSFASEPIRTPPASADGTLDLRIRRDWTEECHKTDNNNNNEDHIRSPLDNPDQWNVPEATQTLTLSGTHLKRAKMMFLYARYPSSSVLKTFFPEVTFTRSTTAQMVKWFSNFREFFYIQIEKYVRQCKHNGMKASDEVLITRTNELFRNLEMHYNKDREIETPEEFLHTTQVAVHEFSQAICNGLDRDSSWKKAIYKVIAPMDVPFPEFLKHYK